jgi:predicted esterase
MNSTIIFLHGKGSFHDHPKYAIFEKIARKEDAKIIGIDAPFPHKAGFRWFDGDNLGAEFSVSKKYLEEKIAQIVKAGNLEYENLIYLSHSQGGVMAINQALAFGAKKVIALAPCIMKDAIPDNPRKGFVIHWIEAGMDGVLDTDRKNSYRILQDLGINVVRTISEDSTHDIFAESLLNY